MYQQSDVEKWHAYVVDHFKKNPRTIVSTHAIADSLNNTGHTHHGQSISAQLVSSYVANMAKSEKPLRGIQYRARSQYEYCPGQPGKTAGIKRSGKSQPRSEEGIFQVIGCLPNGDLIVSDGSGDLRQYREVT